LEHFGRFSPKNVSEHAAHLVSVEDLGDAAVADPELARDDARPDSGRGHLDDLEADVVGQRPAVDEHAAELVDAPLTFEANNWRKRREIICLRFEVICRCLKLFVFV
jgi:hypothetical protein